VSLRRGSFLRELPKVYLRIGRHRGSALVDRFKTMVKGILKLIANLIAIVRV
jgi:hypothetical protein